MPILRFQHFRVEDAAVHKEALPGRQVKTVARYSCLDGSFLDHDNFKFIVPMGRHSNLRKFIIEKGDGEIRCAIGQNFPSIFIHLIN